MYYNDLGNEYLRQSEQIKEHIKKIRLEAKDGSNLQKREARKRILMLYDIAFEMYCIGNRLKEGDNNDAMLH